MHCSPQFEIWSALQLLVPIITVMISGAYRFAQASEAFADLPKALNAAAARSRNRTSSPSKADNRGSSPSTSNKVENMVANLILKRTASTRSDQNKSERSDAAADSWALDALKARLPSGTDVATVGKTIHERCAPFSRNPWFDRQTCRF